MAKIEIKELEKALTHIKNKLHSVTVTIAIDPMGRVLLKTSDDDVTATITLYDTETHKFAEITETKRL